MSDKLLQVENLCASYGDFVAVDSVSLHVNKGQIVSLMGLNNSGKTTLVNTIVKLLNPTSGKIIFKDEDITSLTPEKVVSRGISLVPQGGRCFKKMSVEDNLLMGCYPRQARKKAKQSLENIYGLFPVLERMRKAPAGSLSGGQRQMVAIGRSLMGEPQCIIFDEISLGLSPAIIQDIYNQMRKINDLFSTSMILIEQDTQRALEASDYCYVMLKGKIAFSGEPTKIEEQTLKKAYFGR